MSFGFQRFLIISTGLIFQPIQALNMMDAYSSVIRYSDLLHGTLQEAAQEVAKFDIEGARAIENFEYNWLSLMGIYKGIFPIVSDFFMNYYGSAEFMSQASHLSQALVGIYESFMSKRDTDVIFTRITDLTANVLKSGLFQDGAINSFLDDLRDLEANKDGFKVIVRTLQKRGSEVQELLHFIITGRMMPSKSPPNSEL